MKFQGILLLYICLASQVWAGVEEDIRALAEQRQAIRCRQHVADLSQIPSLHERKRAKHSDQLEALLDRAIDPLLLSPLERKTMLTRVDDLSRSNPQASELLKQRLVLDMKQLKNELSPLLAKTPWSGQEQRQIFEAYEYLKLLSDQKKLVDRIERSLDSYGSSAFPSAVKLIEKFSKLSDSKDLILTPRQEDELRAYQNFYARWRPAETVAADRVLKDAIVWEEGMEKPILENCLLTGPAEADLQSNMRLFHRVNYFRGLEQISGGEKRYYVKPLTAISSSLISMELPDGYRILYINRPGKRPGVLFFGSHGQYDQFRNESNQANIRRMIASLQQQP